MINVTKTFFPPLEEYNLLLKRVWENEWLTNRGELTLELESKLGSYLDIDNIILMNNGTIPIQIALKLLGNHGEIITTPFSYVATSAAIVWENCTPVFVDIDPMHLTIDETKIEDSITSNTTAILATHVFGNPCNIDAIERIAKKHNIKVIYDAAHCFGVKYKNKSIFDYGDISTCSFHATKLFHTGEGGALFCSDNELRQQCYYSHNFGHDGPLKFHGLGINGKISELQSAMGLALLPYMDHVIQRRADVVHFYQSHLNFNKLSTMKVRENTTWNYSYFPIIFNSEKELVDAISELNKIGVNPRRYFYPSLNTIEYVTKDNMPVSESIASRVLCLPLYVDIPENVLIDICSVVNANLIETNKRAR